MGHEVLFMDVNNPFPDGHRGYGFVPIRYGHEAYVIKQLQDVQKQFKPDVVHVHFVDQRAFLCARAGLRPLVLSVWGSDINDHFLPGADTTRRHMMSMTLSAADLVVVDAPFMETRCRELAGRNIRTELIHLGVNGELFRPGYTKEAADWRRKLDVPQKAGVMLSARAWAPHYRQREIMEAFSRAIPRLNRESILLYKIHNRISYPENRKYEMELRNLAIELGISQNVRWIEEVPMERLPEIYAMSDVVINYPTKDTLPVTFLEAAACEKPVISILLPSYAKTFAEKLLMMVGPGSDNLTDAIVCFINGGAGDVQARMKEARRIVLNDFNECTYMARLNNAYLDLTD
ncbi:MAG: glycosyltransferase [Syntrophobacteraceae bacterium]